MQINLSLCRLELQTIISCCLSSECHADSLGTKNVLSTHAQNFWKVNKSGWQKRCDRPQKKTLENNECLYVASVSEQKVREPPTENVPSSENYFPKNCRSFISMLSNSLKQDQDNCFNVFLKTWEMLLHTGFIFLLHIFFAIKSTTFFTLTVISRLVYFLIRR